MSILSSFYFFSAGTRSKRKDHPNYSTATTTLQNIFTEGFRGKEATSGTVYMYPFTLYMLQNYLVPVKGVNTCTISPWYWLTLNFGITCIVVLYVFGLIPKQH